MLDQVFITRSYTYPRKAITELLGRIHMLFAEHILLLADEFRYHHNMRGSHQPPQFATTPLQAMT
jgi:hypothetical protein